MARKLGRPLLSIAGVVFVYGALGGLVAVFGLLATADRQSSEAAHRILDLLTAGSLALMTVAAALAVTALILLPRSDWPTKLPSQ